MALGSALVGQRFENPRELLGERLRGVHRLLAVAIEITFDFGTDATGKNAVPDTSSPTLLHYHHLLWSKRLPGASTSNSPHGNSGLTLCFTTRTRAGSC